MSFGMLVRMPFTPLRHDAPVLGEEAWRPLLGKAKSICETNGLEFRLSHAWPEYAATQALAMERPAGLLACLSEKGFVSWDGLPPNAAREVEQWIEGQQRLLLAEKPADHGFPFNFLETEDGRKALFRQYLDAKAEKDTGYLGSAGRRTAVSPQSVRELASITDRKRGLRLVLWEAAFPREVAGLGTVWKESWLMRRFLSLCQAQVENVLSFNEVLSTACPALAEEVPWFGKSVVAVTAWDADSFRSAARGLPELFGKEILGFTPGASTRIRVSLFLPAPVFSDPAGRLASVLKDSHAPVTIRRNGGSFRFEVPEKSARKKAVLEGRGQETSDGVRMELVIGVKFRLDDLLSSFGSDASEGRAARRGALVEVLSVS